MITVFSSSSCAPCKQLKHYLSLKNVQYKERSVDDEPNLRDELIQLVGYAIFPTVTIERNGQVEIVAGYNLGKLSKLIVSS